MSSGLFRIVLGAFPVAGPVVGGDLKLDTRSERLSDLRVSNDSKDIIFFAAETPQAPGAHAPLTNHSLGGTGRAMLLGHGDTHRPVRNGNPRELEQGNAGGLI